MESFDEGKPVHPVRRAQCDAAASVKHRNDADEPVPSNDMFI